MKFNRFFGIATMSIAVVLGFSSCDDKDKSDPKEKNHVFLCIGQSNMEGNAAIQTKDKTVDPRFQSYVCYAGNYAGQKYEVGDLRTAVPPLCRAGQMGGIGVTDYFGRTMVKYLPEDETVRVAVVALGGTAIDGFLPDLKDNYIKGAADWLQGYYKCYNNDPMARLLEVAKIAQKEGTIQGILFHQGETDAYSAEWNKKVKRVYDMIINELGLDETKVPLLAGNVTGNGNQCIKNIPNYIVNSYVIPSDGCPGDAQNNNNIHFNHSGYEKMGERYALKMLDLMGIKHD